MSGISINGKPIKPVKFIALTLILMGWWTLDFYYRAPGSFHSAFFVAQYVCLVIFAAYYLYLIFRN